MVEQVAAEPEDDALAHDREPADQHELADPADGVQGQVGDHDDRQRVLVALGDAVVDRGAHQEPSARLGRGAAGRDGDQAGDEQPPAGQVPAEAGEAGAARRH